MRLNKDVHGVELHIHLDGAIRPKTLYELAHQRGINIKGQTYEEFLKAFEMDKPYSLEKFLEPFNLTLPIISGDQEALCRVAAEFVEDCINHGRLCYAEARIAPHTLSTTKCGPEEVTKTILESLKRANEKYGIEVRLILSIMRDKPETAKEVLELAKNYKVHGVVGIDVVGDDKHHEFYPQEIVSTYQMAKQLNIHRAVHAGENSPASAVHEAVWELHAERVGHGYAILNDANMYELVRNAGVHFEVCPSSSLLTGSVVETPTKMHPINQFFLDQINFSINTDDPVITKRWLPEEAIYCMEHFGISPFQLVKAQFNASAAAFLDSDEDKEALINHLMEGIGAKTIKSTRGSFMFGL